MKAEPKQGKTLLALTGPTQQLVTLRSRALAVGEAMLNADPLVAAMLHSRKGMLSFVLRLAAHEGLAVLEQRYGITPPTNHG